MAGLADDNDARAPLSGPASLPEVQEVLGSVSPQEADASSFPNEPPKLERDHFELEDPAVDKVHSAAFSTYIFIGFAYAIPDMLSPFGNNWHMQYLATYCALISWTPHAI